VSPGGRRAKIGLNRRLTSEGWRVKSRPWLSVDEAAEVIGVHANTIRRWVDAYLAGGRQGEPGVLVGWYSPKRSGRGRERRVDEADARRVAREGMPPESVPPGA
jgi:transposase-like protein